MKRTTIYLPDGVHRALRRAALDQDVSMAELIRRMSEFYLHRDELFWQTVDQLRKANVGSDPREVARDVVAAVRQVRQEGRSKKRVA